MLYESVDFQKNIVIISLRLSIVITFKKRAYKMISVFLQSLALASVGLIAPGSITLVILLLMSDHGWRNGVAFASGYIVMYSLIGAVMLLLGGNWAANGPTEQSLTTSFILLGLGIVLLAVSIRNWRKQPSVPQKEEPSRFAKLVDSITPLKAFGLAVIVSVVNVKNLTIFLSAVSVLLLSDLLLATQLTMLVPLVLLFCTSVITPVAIYLFFPDRASDYLNRIKDTISRYSRPLGITVTLILGCLFLYRGISGLL
ncbi:MAG: GAP family protein [Anaerolineales bacterium]|nr:GAP family protein [Anaerolineales bacterium]